MGYVCFVVKCMVKTKKIRTKTADNKNKKEIKMTNRDQKILQSRFPLLHFWCNAPEVQQESFFEIPINNKEIKNSVQQTFCKSGGSR